MLIKRIVTALVVVAALGASVSFASSARQGTPNTIAGGAPDFGVR